MSRPFTTARPPPLRTLFWRAALALPLSLALTLATGVAFAKDDDELAPDGEEKVETAEPDAKPAEPATTKKPRSTGSPATPAPPPPPPPDEPWPLTRWEDEARRNSPMLGEAAAETSLQQARLLESAWARFPRMEWQSTLVPVPSLRGDVLNTISAVTNFTGFNGTYQQHKIDVNLPLFTFGRLRAAKHAAAEAKEAALAGERVARADVVLEVGRSYESVKVADELGELYDAAQKRLLRVDRKLEEFLEAGSHDADELDKNRFTTLAADFANQRAESSKFSELSRFALRNAAGIDQTRAVGVDARPLALRTVALESIEALVKEAPAARADLEAGAHNVAVRRAQLDGAQAAYWPELFASGTVGVSRCNVCADQKNPFVFDFLNIDLWSASLGLRLNLDYGMKIARARQASAELGKAAAGQRRLQEAARLEVRDAYGKWKQAVAGVGIASKARTSAESWLLTMEERFLSGKVRASDYAEVLGLWLRFSGDALRAIYNANVAALTLERAAGRSLVER